MHRTVLLQEVISALAVSAGEVFVDGTIGNGGHALPIARSASGAMTLIGIDADEDALARTKAACGAAGIEAHLFRENFRNIDTVLAAAGIAKANAILFDLGFSTEELMESGRGFSFNKNEPLLMTFQKEGAAFTARDVVNLWSEENLTLILSGFGEERYARRIAHAIVAARRAKPIETSGELAALVRAALPPSARRSAIHPATKTFQAIRVAVNDERGALTEGLRKALTVLAPGGRIVVISFHSGEDRIVKRIFKEAEKNGAGNTNKKPIIPSREEVRTNPRARSARLRIFKKSS